jgi:hypothetical protein
MHATVASQGPPAKKDHTQHEPEAVRSRANWSVQFELRVWTDGRTIVNAPTKSVRNFRFGCFSSLPLAFLAFAFCLSSFAAGGGPAFHLSRAKQYEEGPSPNAQLLEQQGPKSRK